MGDYDDHLVSNSFPEEVRPSIVTKRRSSATTDTSITNIWIRKLRKNIYNFIESTPIQVFLMILLMVSLFISDSWTLGNAPDAENSVLNGILLAVFIVFIFEVICLAWVLKGYRYSVFCLMDIIGTISIIFDISFIFNDKETGSHISVLRTTRIARIGARYQRLLRLLKLARYYYPISVFLPQRRRKSAIEIANVRKVSKELASVISVRVAALVVIIAIVLPFLAYNYLDSSPDAWIQSTIPLLSTSCSFPITGPVLTELQLQSLASNIESFYHGKDQKLYSIQIDTPWLPEPVFYQQYNPHSRNVRSESIIIHEDDFLCSNTATNSYQTYTMTVTINNTVPEQLSALYNIILLIVVIILLFVFSASFNKAVDTLVLTPLQHMMSSIRKSAASVIRSIESVEEKARSISGDEGKPSDLRDSNSRESDELETEVLEKVIEKLARIAQNVVGGVVPDINIDNNDVDKNTVSWLTQNYTASNAPKGAVSPHAQYFNANNNELLSPDGAKEDLLGNLPCSASILHSWEFDVLLYKKEQLNDSVIYIFKSLDLFEQFQISLKIFHNFLEEISTRYVSSNPYHNYSHGVDVMHTTYRLLTVSSLINAFSKIEILAVLIAAIGHDIGHIGVNNIYLVKSKHDLALRHNDRSPLENMHCATLYEILNKKETNIFNQLTEAQWRETRKIILASILGTDMTHHFEQINKMKLFLEVNGEDTKKFCRYEKDTIDCFADESNRIFILEMLLHTSDISNPFKPFEISSKWSNLVLEEFCLQGDREKKEGLEVSPMMDRDLINLCNMQLGFIEFVVAPLITVVLNVFPPLYEIGNTITDNFAQWSRLRKEEIESDSGSNNTRQASILEKMEEFKKIDERNLKFHDKFQFLQEFQVIYSKRNRGSTKSDRRDSSSHGSAISSPNIQSSTKASLFSRQPSTPHSKKRGSFSVISRESDGSS